MFCSQRGIYITKLYTKLYTYLHLSHKENVQHIYATKSSVKKLKINSVDKK